MDVPPLPPLPFILGGRGTPVLRSYAAVPCTQARPLGANFDDPRGVGPLSQANQVENLDGARFEHSPQVRQLNVWTNRRGLALLQEIQRDTGVLPEFVGTACH
jgi:hypothetical protein